MIRIILLLKVVKGKNVKNQKFLAKEHSQKLNYMTDYPIVKN